ncbi:MAG: hypothetical protein Q8N99_03055 [Nanoarchaeota archaeon]|nr:hypothetical protein [Nanoarchaeota archaeon]
MIKNKIKKTLCLPHLKRRGFLDDPKSKTPELQLHSKECGFRFMDIIKCMILIFAIIINLSFINAAASFQVTSFSCSPAESVINSVFSCNAQINNIGDASGSISTVTLYPDSNNWLENSNYPQSSGTTVGAGQSTEITFTGLKAVKSGKYGFSKIMLDSVSDTYVADNNIKVNVIDVAVSVRNSASSAAMSSNVVSTVEVTAGGNIDVILTLSISGGGCSIGSQSGQKTISGMQNGNKQSRTWTITQGTSGNCVFSISAAATGEEGIATKTNSVPNTITCTNCPTDSSTPVSSAGGSSGGGVGKTIKNLGELNIIQVIELSSNENVKFNISGNAHSVSVINLTETMAIIVVQSKKQTFVLSVGEEKNVDLNEDNKADINIKIKSINILTKKVKLELSPISGNAQPSSEQTSGTNASVESEKTSEKGSNGISKVNNIWIYIIIGIIILIIIIFIVYMIIKRSRR